MELAVCATPLDTGRRRESCRDITENEGQAQNDTKEEARNPTKGQNYTRSPDPPSPGGRRALGGLDVEAPARSPSTTADDGRQDAIVDISAPTKGPVADVQRERLKAKERVAKHRRKVEAERKAKELDEEKRRRQYAHVDLDQLRRRPRGVQRTRRRRTRWPRRRSPRR